jgi:hypothetical protein
LGFSLIFHPLFLAIIKLLSSRRVTDEALKKQALYTANLLAQVLSGHLVWPGAGKPQIHLYCHFPFMSELIKPVFFFFLFFKMIIFQILRISLFV